MYEVDIRDVDSDSSIYYGIESMQDNEDKGDKGEHTHNRPAQKKRKQNNLESYFSKKSDMAHTSNVKNTNESMQGNEDKMGCAKSTAIQFYNAGTLKPVFPAKRH